MTSELLDALHSGRNGDQPDVDPSLLEESPFRPDEHEEPWIDVPATNGAAVEPPATPFEIIVYSARELADLDLPRPADPVSPHTRVGMVTLIGGITGHGKTTWIAHEIRQAAETGAAVLMLDLEQNLASLQRVIREAGLSDLDAVDFAPIPEGLALERRADQLDALEQKLAAKPYRLLAVDPFYKLHTGDSNDEAQARGLIALLRRWIAAYGFGILTATHCRKLPAGRNTIALDDLYGSSLFTRDPELILGLQRFGDLTRLTVFKSREPDFTLSQTFELLFDRDRGFYPKPTVDPEERQAKIDAAVKAAVAYVADHPGRTTNQVKIAVADELKIGRDLVEAAIKAQVKSGLHFTTVEGSRRSTLWYPLNHAVQTSLDTPPSEVIETPREGQSRADLTGLADLPVGESAVPSEVDEAELDRLRERYADIAEGQA